MSGSGRAPPRCSRTGRPSSGSSRDIPICPPAPHVLDPGDTTVLPGLIDSHSHLVGDSRDGALDRVAGYTGDELAAVVAESLRTQLASGVTVVRDLGDRDWVAVAHRDRQHACSGATGTDPADEPTVFASGPPITSPGGHCYAMGGEVSGPDEIARAVRERADRRVDVVKVMASGGMTTAGTDVLGTQFSDDDLTFLVHEAHRHGLQVTAHAHSLPAVEQALAAGSRRPRTRQLPDRARLRRAGRGAGPAGRTADPGGRRARQPTRRSVRSRPGRRAGPVRAHHRADSGGVPRRPTRQPSGACTRLACCCSPGATRGSPRSSPMAPSGTRSRSTSKPAHPPRWRSRPPPPLRPTPAGLVIAGGGSGPGSAADLLLVGGDVRGRRRPPRRRPRRHPSRHPCHPRLKAHRLRDARKRTLLRAVGVVVCVTD